MLDWLITKLRKNKKSRLEPKNWIIKPTVSYYYISNKKFIVHKYNTRTKALSIYNSLLNNIKIKNLKYDEGR